MKRTVIIGTRGSELALWQANHISGKLTEIGLDPQIKIIKTQGDQIQNLSFDKMEGKGFFTKELEEALLKEQIDLAVHSHKDLPTVSPAGLMIAAVSERENPSEILLINKKAIDFTNKFSLKNEAVVGTSSPRRKSQLLSFRPDITLKELRGNVPTRIQKLRDEQYDAILIAFAGVERLEIDLSEFHCEKIDPLDLIPAPAQGALALQIRENDHSLFNALQQIHVKETAETIGVERLILNKFEGGCQLPLGAYCRKNNNIYQVWISKSHSWNEMPIRLFLESTSTEGLAEKAVRKINNIQPRSVFVTRNISTDNYLKRILSAHNFKVTGQSLIETEGIPFNEVPVSDWIFFSSSNAVSHFFEQQPEITPLVKLAVIGKGTAETLRKYGHHPAYIGEQSDITETGLEFSKMVYGKKVLFPRAQESLRTIQKQLAENTQIIDLPVYRTIYSPEVSVPKTDIVIFTSPSNVESFFKFNKIHGDQIVIAIGKSTGDKLHALGVENFHIPFSPYETSLVELIFSL